MPEVSEVGVVAEVAVAVEEVDFPGKVQRVAAGFRLGEHHREVLRETETFSPHAAVVGVVGKPEAVVNRTARAL